MFSICIHISSCEKKTWTLSDAENDDDVDDDDEHAKCVFAF